MNFELVINDIADVLKRIDGCHAKFKDFHAGVGPYGEPQVVKLVAAELNRMPEYRSRVKTMRTPDLLIHKNWALEIKLARPFGDNGRAAENWSVNLLHPYGGNTSLLGDCLKLTRLDCEEQKGVIAIGYEHDPPQVSLEPLWTAFELLAAGVMRVSIGPRVTARRGGLIHPVHEQLVVVGWELRSQP